MGDPIPSKNSEIISHFLCGCAEEHYYGREVLVVDGHAHLLPKDYWAATSLIAELERQYPNEILHCIRVPHPV